MKTAKKGDSLRDTYTASWYNRVNRALHAIEFSGQATSLPETPLRVPVISDGESFDQFEPASINGPFIDESGATLENSEMFSTISCKITNTLNDFWGVLQSPVSPEQEGVLVLGGLTWAKINYTSSGHDYVTQQSGELVSSTTGRGYIVHPPESTGEGYALILIQSGGGGSVKHATTPAGGIPGKSGNSMGSAICTLTIPNASGVISNKSPAETLTIYNPSRTAVAANTAIVYGIDEAGLPVVLVEDCGE